MNLIELLKGSEGKTLEFKQAIASHLGLVRTVMAFANTAGGILLVGVEDKTRHVTGVSDPLGLEERITNIVNDSIAPQILPEIEILPYKNLSVVAIRIHPSPLRPHFLKSEGLEKSTYVRVGSSNRLADDALIKELQRFAVHQSFDEQPLTQLSLEAIDFQAVSEAFAPFRTLKSGDLETLRLVIPYHGKTVPTQGGILLFGKKREKYFPDAWIQAGRFLGTTKGKIVDTVAIHRYPILAIEAAIDFVRKHATMALEIQAIKRKEHWNIPLQAVREAVINAVTHADYSQIGAPIRLSIFQDRLEIENPGLLPFGLTVEEILKGVSKLRNRVIGRVFNELKLIEQWGSGIQRMLLVCQEAGLQVPKFEEIGTHFRVTIYINPYHEPYLDEQDQTILHLLKQQNGLSTLAISKEINRSSRATRTRLASLVTKGLIVEISSSQKDPTKRYFLRK